VDAVEPGRGNTVILYGDARQVVAEACAGEIPARIFSRRGGCSRKI
jgi:hypothetical protein